MSVQDDLLNEEKYVLNQSSNEAPETTQVCSFWQDELDEICSFWQDDTRGDRLFAVEESAIKKGYGFLKRLCMICPPCSRQFK